MIHIQASVGLGGLNRPDNVQVVHNAINLYRRRYRLGREIPRSNRMSAELVKTIQDMQRRIGVTLSGRIRPMSPYLCALDRAGGLADLGMSTYVTA